MKFEIFNENKNNLRVAFFSKKTFGGSFYEKKNIQKIAEYNHIEIHLFDTPDEEFSIFKDFKSHKQLVKKEEIRKIYKEILGYIRKNKIEICIFFGSGYPWHNNFLRELKKYSYVACYFGDDPEGCETTSQYYVKNYNYAFCGGVYFDKNTKISEKYLEWGAKKSKFIPLGVYPKKRREINNFEDREIDLVYVGGCYLPKVFRIFKLKKHFGSRMKMYGRGWSKSNNFLKTAILKAIKFIYKIPQIEELPKDEIVDLYQNTKIGFNIHMSYGPSNVRMYELPANGVMQICDCENGLKELYKINKEVIVYKNINDAIKKIEYYLKNNKERIKIAKAGYKKVLENYKVEYSFELLLSEINDDIIY